MTDQQNSSGERYIAVNQCTKKVYGFIPDSWALVDTECHNTRRATGSREAMQFLEKELNTRASVDAVELVERLTKLRALAVFYMDSNTEWTKILDDAIAALSTEPYLKRTSNE